MAGVLVFRGSGEVPGPRARLSGQGCRSHRARRRRRGHEPGTGSAEQHGRIHGEPAVPHPHVHLTLRVAEGIPRRDPCTTGDHRAREPAVREEHRAPEIEHHVRAPRHVAREMHGAGKRSGHRAPRLHGHSCAAMPRTPCARRSRERSHDRAGQRDRRRDRDATRRCGKRQRRHEENRSEMRHALMCAVRELCRPQFTTCPRPRGGSAAARPPSSGSGSPCSR